MDFHIGCPVWSFKGWVGNFYPVGTRPEEFLQEYARRLTTIEGNTTFYAVPARETVESWAADTPEYFRFCPKIPRAISHESNRRHVPFGAHPYAVYKYYDYDPLQLKEYHESARDNDAFQRYLEKYVYGVGNHREYLEAIGGRARLSGLLVKLEYGYSPNLERTR